MIRMLLTWLILDGKIASVKATRQSPFRLISLLKKFLKFAKVFFGKMNMEADETNCMVSSFQFCERLAIVSNFHQLQLI